MLAAPTMILGRTQQVFLVVSVRDGVLSDLANVTVIVLSRAVVGAWFG